MSCFLQLSIHFKKQWSVKVFWEGNQGTSRQRKQYNRGDRGWITFGHPQLAFWPSPHFETWQWHLENCWNVDLLSQLIFLAFPISLNIHRWMSTIWRFYDKWYSVTKRLYLVLDEFDLEYGINSKIRASPRKTEPVIFVGKVAKQRQNSMAAFSCFSEYASRRTDCLRDFWFERYLSNEIFQYMARLRQKMSPNPSAGKVAFTKSRGLIVLARNWLKNNWQTGSGFICVQNSPLWSNVFII